ncbi:BRCA1-associated, partial [Olea europaea subsp. europaea]
ELPSPSIPVSVSRSRMYFSCDTLIPLFDLATSIPKKYRICPRSFISNSVARLFSICPSQLYYCLLSVEHVNTVCLCVCFGYQSSFIAFYSPISFILHIEHPFTINWFLTLWGFQGLLNILWDFCIVKVRGFLCTLYLASLSKLASLCHFASQLHQTSVQLYYYPLCYPMLLQKYPFLKPHHQISMFTQLCKGVYRQVCRLCQQQDEKPACAVCGNLNNLWVCLICGFIGCGRYEKGHVIGHWSDKQHCFTLEVEKQQIWDYVGERYVHRLNQSKGVGKSVMINSECNSIGERGTCGCDGGEELDGALFGSKVEVILDEYNHLLASQLEIQRKKCTIIQEKGKNLWHRSTTFITTAKFVASISFYDLYPYTRVTGVDDSLSAHARGGGLPLVGQRLAKVAEACGMQFEFNGAGMWDVRSNSIIFRFVPEKPWP